VQADKTTRLIVFLTKLTPNILNFSSKSIQHYHLKVSPLGFFTFGIFHLWE
jgi:hypothetical protein